MNLPKKQQIIKCLNLTDLPIRKNERVFDNQSIETMMSTFTLQGAMGFLLAYGYFYDADYLRSETQLFMTTHDLTKYFIY